MKANLTPISTGITKLELFAETPDERVALETIRTSGFCNSHHGDRKGSVAVSVKVLSPDFERAILALLQQTVNTSDEVRAFLAPLANRSTELRPPAETDFRRVYIEEAPKCPNCGIETVRHGAVFDCPNCGERLGSH